MLSQEKIKKIMALKSMLTPKWINEYDEQWNDTVKRIKSSRVNLGNILLVGVTKECTKDEE